MTGFRSLSKSKLYSKPPSNHINRSAGFLRAVCLDFIGCLFEVWPAPGARECPQKGGGLRPRIFESIPEPQRPARPRKCTPTKSGQTASRHPVPDMLMKIPNSVRGRCRSWPHAAAVRCCAPMFVTMDMKNPHEFESAVAQTALSGSLAILNSGFGIPGRARNPQNPVRDCRNRAPWARGQLRFS